MLKEKKYEITGKLLLNREKGQVKNEVSDAFYHDADKLGRSFGRERGNSPF